MTSIKLLTGRARDWVATTTEWSRNSLSKIDQIVIGSVASIILILAMTSLHERNEMKRTAAERLAVMSNGAFDGYAQDALKALSEKTRAELDANQLFARAQLKDLNLHEGTRPTHTRSHEADILHDYAATLTKPGTDRWMRRRIQDFLDRRFTQFEEMNIPMPVQYNTLQAELDAQQIYNDHLENVSDSQPGIQGSLRRLEASKEWKANDTQNVHDSGVHNSLRDMIGRIKERDAETILPLGEYSARDDILRHIGVGDFADAVKQKATNACLNAYQSNAMHPSLSNLNESQVMELVWRRSYHPSNSEEQRNNIRDMFVHNLADMITSDQNARSTEQVCVTGRIGRMVDSLTLTDAESINVGQPLSLEMMRNDVFEFAQKALKQKVEQFTSAGNDDCMHQVAKSYNDLTVEVSPEAEEEFKKSIVSETGDYMVQQYGDLISPNHQQDLMNTVRDAL